jgi:hypothetical protein
MMFTDTLMMLTADGGSLPHEKAAKESVPGACPQRSCR